MAAGHSATVLSAACVRGAAWPADCLFLLPLSHQHAGASSAAAALRQGCCCCLTETCKLPRQRTGWTGASLSVEAWPLVQPQVPCYGQDWWHPLNPQGRHALSDRLVICLPEELHETWCELPLGKDCLKDGKGQLLREAFQGGEPA